MFPTGRPAGLSKRFLASALNQPDRPRNSTGFSSRLRRNWPERDRANCHLEIRPFSVSTARWNGALRNSSRLFSHSVEGTLIRRAIHPSSYLPIFEYTRSCNCVRSHVANFLSVRRPASSYVVQGRYIILVRLSELPLQWGYLFEL